jgi:hypothetical protein
MMIECGEPRNWKELQDRVGRIFNEIGYKTRIGKTTRMVRGKTNIDVLAQNVAEEPHVLYLCECKHWSRRVSQQVIQAVRTDVVDVGANYGLIISKRGFQGGSYRKTKFTNVMLMTWEQFQEKFLQKWVTGMANRSAAIADELMPFTEYLIGRRLESILDQLPEPKQKEMLRLNRAFDHVACMAFEWGQEAGFFRGRVQKLQPCVLGDPLEPSEEVPIRCYRDYAEYIFGNCRRAMKLFERTAGQHLFSYLHPRSGIN